ncbi:MAG: hypothetical protein LBR80_06370 [Deltaproteobacteria bacterium]|jgi:hypothetical protein|nr:hypothetical protein [Deltaproteobacteria bacterium]
MPSQETAKDNGAETEAEGAKGGADEEAPGALHVFTEVRFVGKLRAANRWVTAEFAATVDPEISIERIAVDLMYPFACQTDTPFDVRPGIPRCLAWLNRVSARDICSRVG